MSANVADTEIEAIEEDPDFLEFVFKYYTYPETWDTMAVTLITAQSDQVTRQDIFHAFIKYGVTLTEDHLDTLLKFLVTFGVLNRLKGGRYCLSSPYLRTAIADRTGNTDILLISEFFRIRKRPEEP